MKVHNSTAPHPRSKVTEARNESVGSGNSATSSSAAKDRVAVSTHGAGLAEQVADLGGVEGASEARVAEVKTELESGTSPLDIRAMAESILRDEGL